MQIILFARGSCAELQKALRITKLALFLSVITATLSLAASAPFGQSTRISLEAGTKTLRELFSEIEAKSEFIFLYNDNAVDISETVRVSGSENTVPGILDSALKNTLTRYKIIDRQIILYRAGDDEKTVAPATVNPGLQGAVPGDMKTIKGTVKSKTGEPLAGVVINLENALYVATSDENGNYELKIPILIGNSARLTARLLGMKILTVEYGGKSVVDIIMEYDDKKIDEVVVTGYQTIARTDMVGSYTTIEAKDILVPNYTSIDQMLQGQVAGMIVTNVSNRVGSAPSITLRGVSSLLGTTSPLWVVDGIIQQDIAGINSTNPMITGSDNDISQYLGSVISWLNPNDIETVTVLKDASATAIYGSRASNGVIVITTKKGKPGKSSVSYSADLTVSIRPTYDDYYVMNSKERINFSKEAFDAGAYYIRAPIPQMYTYEGLMQLYMASQISEEQFAEQYKYLETVNTDWLKLLTRTSTSHKHYLNISGGSANLSYNMSANYTKRQGTEKGNESDMFSGRLRLGIDVSPRFKVDFSLTGTITKTNGFISDVNPLSYAINTSRAIPAFDGNGNRLFYQKYAEYKYNSNVATTGLKYNILNEMEHSYTELGSSQINATANIDYNILKDGSLRYNFTGGYTNSSGTTESYADERTFYVAKNYRGYDYGSVEDATDPLFKAAMMPNGGQLIMVNTRTFSYNIQNKLHYSKTFGNAHRVNAMFASEIRSTDFNQNTNTILGYMKYKGGQVVTPTYPADLVPISGSASGWGLLEYLYTNGQPRFDRVDNFVSFFTSIAWSYKNRYVLNFNVRNDASNRFGQDTNKQFDPTYSFGGAWHASEETFMEELGPLLSRLTIKATFGVQGNALNNISPELILIYPRLNTTYNQFTSSISNLPNENLTWERTKTGNLGINLGLFDNKLSLDVDGYFRNSKPLSLLRLSPEYGRGNDGSATTGARLRNSGIEVTLTGSPVRKKDMLLSLSMNFSKNWNKAKTTMQNADQYSISTNSYLSGNNFTGIILEKGYPVSGFWAYEFDKLDPQSGYAAFKNMDMTDYSSRADFLTYVGEKEPVMSAGINVNFSYKSLSVSSGLVANLGGKQRLTNVYSQFPNYLLLPGPDVNLSRELSGRWKKPGDEQHTNMPGVYTGGTARITDPSGYSATIYQMWANSDVRIVNSSFLRCRNIMLSWRAPKKVTGLLSINTMTLSASCSNIFVIASSKFKGMDPETGTSVMPKSFSMGLNVNF